jgi:hypothetical protein
LAGWCVRASQFTRICIGAAIKNGELSVIDHTTAQIAKLLRVKGATSMPSPPCRPSSVRWQTASAAMARR